MQKLINDPRHLVRELLEGQVDLNPGQALLADDDVIIQAGLSAPKDRPVAILSGGGSGHEPAHAGYVGTGMLSGAIAGEVFTSPSVDAVLAGIRACAGPKGAVLIVKNYTGDRLNFGLAAELATAEGIPTEIVVVADDVALRNTVEPARRRGIAGTVLVHKVAGAAAASGAPLAEVVRLARAAAQEVGTMGVALGSCTVPAAGKPGFELSPGEMELGLGIHGEQGVLRTALQPVNQVVETLLDTILTDREIGAGARVVLLVNGLGGTPPMELTIAGRHALAVLRGKGITVERVWTGGFMTAIEMPGLSLSLLPVDDARLALLDAPSAAPAWPGAGHIAPRKMIEGAAAPAAAAPAPAAGPLAPALKAAALKIAAALEAAETHLTELDSRAGDGDLGISMVRGAEAIQALPETVWATPAHALTEISNALRRAIAGSSGPFYAVGLLRAARELGAEVPSTADWAEAFAKAVASVSELGGAKAGDRTMLDALLPGSEAFSAAASSGKSLSEAWAEAVAATEAGAAATATMAPRLGRAAYLGERAMGAPDAGASAVSVWMRALLG